MQLTGASVACRPCDSSSPSSSIDRLRRTWAQCLRKVGAVSPTVAAEPRLNVAKAKTGSPSTLHAPLPAMREGTFVGGIQSGVL
jgi:hypothetical protein